MLFSKKTTLILLLVIAFFSGIFIHASLIEDDKIQQAFEQNYHTYALNMPANLSFAGEKVPMNEAEVRERYDREILTNVYWQSATLLMIKRAHRSFPAIEKILKKNGVPSDFKYLALIESGMLNVVSPAGATGVWQFLDATAKHFGLEVTEEIDERYHLEKSTEAACAYLKEAYEKFGTWTAVAASYNMGMDGVKKQLLSQQVNNYYDLYLNQETSRYVFRILAAKQILEHPEKFGFRFNQDHLYQPIPAVKIKVEARISNLATWALDNGSNYKYLKLLNPWLRKNFLSASPAKVYYISFPKEKLKLTKIAKINENDTLSLLDTKFKPDE